MPVDRARLAGLQPPAAHRLGRQDAEQVEVRRLLVFEEAHIKPRVVGPAEHLEAAIGLDQAHRAWHLLVDRVSRVRNGGQTEEFGEDRLGYPVTPPGAPSARHGGRGRWGGWRPDPRPGTRPRVRTRVSG